VDWGAAGPRSLSGRMAGEHVFGNAGSRLVPRIQGGWHILNSVYDLKLPLPLGAASFGF
jgi:hypothetical protein